MFDEMEYEVVQEVENFFGEQRTTSEMSRERLRKNIELFQKSGINVDSLLVDYHLKLSMPLAALIFILIGTPLSLSTRDSRSASITFTIVIVFLYYLILSLSQSFGKNGKITPLLAAWLPNMSFGVIGIVLLFWRETWQNWVSRLLPGIFSMFLIIILLSPVAGAEGDVFQPDKIKVYRAEELSYNPEIGGYEISGEIIGQYGKYHIFAENVTIKLEDGEEITMSRPKEIDLHEGKFSGCDLEKPHYYFDAREVNIYPGDHLVARNVFFRELNGALPLFYWPYLYISLKDRSQRFVPRVGYNARRGWFIKTTYYHWYDDRLPGEIYLDYYNISGYAGGFKQHFLYQPDLKGYLYLYGQENRTDIPGLFNWQGQINLNDQQGSWKTDTNLDYTEYDDYSYLKGRVNLSNKTDTQNLNLSSSFSSKDYFLSDNRDDQELDFDLKYQLNLPRDWRLYLDYNRDYIFNPEDGLKRRWGSKSYLSRRFNNLDLRITMERYAPRFTEEEEEEERVRFYRWPEIELGYNPPGNLSYDLQLGRYYEESSGIRGNRGRATVGYSRVFNIGENTRLNVRQSADGSIYQQEPLEEEQVLPYYQAPEQVLPYFFSWESRFSSNTRVFEGLTWSNTYNYRDSYGETPFNFDRVSTRERVNSRLRYRYGGFDLSLSSAYDIYNERLSPLSTVMNWQLTPEWRLSLGTSYNLETEIYGDLALTSKYKSEVLELNTALKYNLNDRLLRRVDNRLVYELDDEWYIEANGSYDKEKDTIRTAYLMITKNFHCRKISFIYDHLKKEYMIEYRINLFPEHGIKLGSSEEESFMFDMGIEEILDME